ncbi:WXG100 family type VII secretion target [Streptomyces sp. A3M-1-3]|uniref:WXG100 family type VII secretion target n=1 Tax=Streptomyces sp. A3M-1-3 TaxID=2962044 RepID=UPI0020B901E1|nr:WXG100 family type VII secretion target [Streptomyces sp. A3M-1-3]MCP3821143.1 WXG100 family type VII secretion target [Streptomyces sp. A3M-1-3]
MATPNLNVTTSDHDGLAGEIDNLQQKLDDRIRALNSVVDRIQAGWKGAAGKEYDTLQRGVNEHARKIQVRLVELEETMRMSSKGFTEEEQQRIAELRRLDDTRAGESKILGMA